MTTPLTLGSAHRADHGRSPRVGVYLAPLSGLGLPAGAAVPARRFGFGPRMGYPLRRTMTSQI